MYGVCHFVGESTEAQCIHFDFFSDFRLDWRPTETDMPLTVSALFGSVVGLEFFGTDSVGSVLDLLSQVGQARP